MNPQTSISEEPGRPKRTWLKVLTWTYPAMALLILMSLTGCVSPRVIQSDQIVKRVPMGKIFTPPANGWFLSDALYLRYRKAVADAILREQAITPPAPSFNRAPARAQ